MCQDGVPASKAGLHFSMECFRGMQTAKAKQSYLVKADSSGAAMTELNSDFLHQK